MNEALKSKFNKIKLLIMDVDGVLTDGRIIVDDSGREIKNFYVQDGFGLVIFRKLGYKTAILSARASHAVKHRARDLRIDKVMLNASPKIKYYYQITKALRVKDEEVAFICDDLPDLAVLRQVGLGIAVPNAVMEIKKQADYITQAHGGKGAVRETIELILKVQGKWKKVLDLYR